MIAGWNTLSNPDSSTVWSMDTKIQPQQELFRIKHIKLLKKALVLPSEMVKWPKWGWVGGMEILLCDSFLTQGPLEKELGHIIKDTLSECLDWRIVSQHSNWPQLSKWYTRRCHLVPRDQSSGLYRSISTPWTALKSKLKQCRLHSVQA
jgi:hypothetical protein